MRSDGRYFELTPRVLDLGYAYVSSLKLPDIAQPFMEELSERVHESVSAAVLDDDEIVYVARVPTKRIMTVSISLGSRLPGRHHLPRASAAGRAARRPARRLPGPDQRQSSP